MNKDVPTVNISEENNRLNTLAHEIVKHAIKLNGSIDIRSINVGSQQYITLQDSDVIQPGDVFNTHKRDWLWSPVNGSIGRTVQQAKQKWPNILEFAHKV